MKCAIPFSLFVLFCCFICSCTPAVIDSINRESLFTLDIGPMEDQIALYSLEGDKGKRSADITMRDGLFYITDRNGGKIVHYNSYGNLLFMIYNNETNPDPANLKPKSDDGIQQTRWAFTYPLRSPGKIVVDSRKHIYIEERLPQDRFGFDDENKALLDSVILHFDADGRFIEYIGQGGQGGGPFPHISGLYSSIQDEIAIICRMPGGWNIYWYSMHGEQLFLIQLKNSAIPAPPDWPAYSSSIDNIIPLPDARKLFIKADYYRDVMDESTNTRISTEPVSSLIWILNVEEGVYENSIEVPFYEFSYTERGKNIHVYLLYSMLGVAKGGGILLYFPIETGYAILIMDSSGNKHRRSAIDVDPGELRFNSFHLSPEGILSALLTDDWKIKVVWWRMDQFMRNSL